jgi:hypothetical protein
MKSADETRESTNAANPAPAFSCGSYDPRKLLLASLLTAYQPFKENGLKSFRAAV